MTVSILVISARVAVIARSQNLVISAVIHSPNIDGSDRGDRVGGVAADAARRRDAAIPKAGTHVLGGAWVNSTPCGTRKTVSETE